MDLLHLHVEMLKLPGRIVNSWKLWTPKQGKGKEEKEGKEGTL